MSDSSIPTPVGITEEMIETAAIASFNMLKSGPYQRTDFDALPKDHREGWLASARVGLEAAFAARPMVEAGPAVGITPDMRARGVKALTEPSKDVYSVRALDPDVAEQVVTQVLGAALAGTVVDPGDEDLSVLDARELNAIAATLTELRGFLPLSVRYGAAAVALRHIARRGYGDPLTNNDDGSDEYARMVAESSESGEPRG